VFVSANPACETCEPAWRVFVLRKAETHEAKLKLKPSSLLDTCVIYCGDNLEQLAKARTRLVGGAALEHFESSIYSLEILLR
jgi:hypothetical protein